MGFLCILSLGFSCSAVLNAGDDPLEVVYGPCDNLTVKLAFVNVPYGYNYYDIKKQNSEPTVISGFLDGTVKEFKLDLIDSDDHTVLETFLARPGDRRRLHQRIVKLTVSNTFISRQRPCMTISRSITVDWRAATARTGVEIFTAFEMQSTPRLVHFKGGDVLEFNLKFKNLPEHNSVHDNVYLKTGSSEKQLNESELRLTNEMDGSNLTVQMCFIITKDCNKTDTLTFIRLIHDANRNDPTCLGQVCQIILDWENKYLSDLRPPALAPSLPDDLSKPRVTPQRFVDKGNSYAVFTCKSHGRHLDILSWYQVQGKNTSQLFMKQFTSEMSSAEMSLVLNKTLTTSDNNTLMYCSRTPVGSVAIFSENIYLNFCRNKPNENLYIAVQPAWKFATFSVNTNQSFECGGSWPADGRSYNWYIENEPYSNTFSHAPSESMGSNHLTRNVNLTLHLNESYHLKRIYCVQEYHMYLERTDGYYYLNYGEKVRSNATLLSMVTEDRLTESDPSESSLTVLIYIFLGVVAVILAIISALVIRRRCCRSQDSIYRSQTNNNESIYATAEITYAELQLAPESNNIVRREAATPYAEIIGSCKPKTTRHHR